METYECIATFWRFFQNNVEHGDRGSGNSTALTWAELPEPRLLMLTWNQTPDTMSATFT